MISENDLYEELYGHQLDTDLIPQFVTGDHVRVKSEDSLVRWRRPHLRTPGYIFGLTGVIEKIIGIHSDASLKAFRTDGPQQPLYRVVFKMKDISESCYFTQEIATSEDVVVVDISQSWLEISDGKNDSKSSFQALKKIKVNHDKKDDHHDHDHDHNHDHHDSQAHAHGDHTHETRNKVESNAVDTEADAENPGFSFFIYFLIFFVL